jgi:hypothetical protein
MTIPQHPSRSLW